MSRVCQKCNTVLDDTAKFCYRCGTPVFVPADEETEELRFEDMPNNSFPCSTVASNIPYTSGILSEKEFYERFVSKKAKGWTIAIGVISLISSVSSVALLFLGNFLSIIDIAFYGTMGILILTIKKWGLPLAVTIYSGVLSTISLVTGGTFGGVVAMIVGIYATINLKKINDAYKQYRRLGILPQKLIE